MSVRVKIEHGQHAGRVWRLSATGVYTLGRHPDCSIRVLDMKVSKEHCEIHVTGASADKVVLKDLGSTHGCQVNGQPVRGERPLNAGDELRLGLTILRILSDGTADAEAKPATGRSASTAVATDSVDSNTKKTLADDALVGKELGGYKVERKIGQGGMGGVYLAEQVSLRRKVALKVLSEKFASDNAFVDQFLNEARAAGQLNHPNVVQVYDVGQADGQYFFSMEVMPGGSVEDRLREDLVEWPVALNFFIDAANALIFAHKRGILHRDVKPDNLMISESGDAKLCDLGLAKRSEVSDLMDQGIIGTPHFIAPEAIRRRNDIDHRTDLYSLGCTFYRVLTRQNPFPGQNVKEILLGHLNKPAPAVSDINKDVPRELSDVIQKLMAKEVGDRYQTPDDLLRSLDRIRTQYHLESHGLKPATKKPLIIAAIIALGAVGAAGWFVMNANTEGPPPKETEEAKEARLAVARQRVGQELQGAVLEARGDAQKQRDRDLEERLGPATWNKPRWPEISGDMVALADRLKDLADGWAQSLAQEPDPTLQGYYREQGALLATVEQGLRERAAEIDSAVAKFQRLEARIQSEREKALGDLGKAIEGHASTVQQHFMAQAYVELEVALQAEVLEGLTKEILARAVEDVQLVDAKDDLAPLLDKHFPLADPKDPTTRGQGLLDKAVQLIESRGGEALAKARQAQLDTPGQAGIAAAIEILTQGQESLPETPKPEVAPRMQAALTRTKANIQEVLTGLKAASNSLREAQLAQDRTRYYQLVQTLRRPAGRQGLMTSFGFQLSKDAAFQAHKAMKTEEFQQLTAAWMADVDAMDQLFAHARDGHSAWANDKVELEDDKGRSRKGRIKALTRTGVSLDPSSLVDEREEIPFADLGPAWLIKHLFFAPPEKSDEAGAPRFEFAAVDLHGLALLAEMAGNFEDAARFWKQTEIAYGEEAGAAVARGHMARLPMEQAAASKWFAILRNVAETDTFLRAHDPTLIGYEEFYRDTSKVREGLLAEATELRRRLQMCADLRAELEELPDLAATVWGTALREGPAHPQVSYASIPVPEGGWPETR